MTRLFDQTGHAVTLDAEIGRGGEGAVYAVEGYPKFVAKVYHEAVDAERTAKFHAMTRLAGPELLKVAAWPIGTLHPKPGGPLVGLLMPSVAGHREVHELYSPAQRRRHFPKADWAFLVHVAMNCAAAFETVHAAGHVVGDVNQSGVLVSSQGTVHLIDCDSFQIDTGGALFPCVVGVPQYTPPELQGKSFRDVRRTVDHDNFGLALLVFHLLFMGRHPFAGRFGGSGDMPIEKAISTGRFAFGRTAASRQMLPPPHTMPLAALPPPVADLFERAFGWPVALPRPTAGQWYAALAGLKATLKPCAVDKGHLFAGGACPWCRLASAGGPDFFASAANDNEPPYVNVAAWWEQVEAISPPPKVMPPYFKTHLIRPQPLPDELADLLMFRRIAGWVALGSLAPVLTFSAILVTIGVLLFLLFGVVWVVLTALPNLRTERQARRDRLHAAEQSLKVVAGQWQYAVDLPAGTFDNVKSDLAALRTPAGRVHLAFQQELAKMESSAREHQAHAFLDRHVIRGHTIPNIGPARTNTLEAFGIETAADINEAAIAGIPGIGEQCVDSLLRWKQNLLGGFHYDPRQGVPPQQRRAVRQKYLQLKHTYEGQYRAGVAQLRDLSETAVRRVQPLLPQADHWQQQVHQARADLAAV